MKTAFYKECYELELKLREQLLSAVSTPITATTLLGGVLVFLIKNFSWRNDIVSFIFGVVLMLVAISLVVAVLGILGANTSYRYKIIADGAALKAWHQSLLAFYGNDDRLTDAAFDDGVENRYIEATAVNSLNNQRKVAFIACVNKALAFATVFTLIGAVPYFIACMKQPEKPTKVEMDKPLKIEIVK